MSWFKYGVSSLSREYLGQKYLSVSLTKDTERFSVEKEIGKGDFDRLVIESGDIDNLEFLSQLLPGGPKRLLIQGGVQSLSGLGKLPNLIDFQCDLSSGKPYPDFSALVNLEKCFIAWDKKYDAKGYKHGLFTLKKLTDLTLRYWTKPDCKEIGQLRQLQRLDLRQGSITSLDGLQNCSGLKWLHLSYLSRLEDVNCLSGLQRLENLHIQNCQKIGDFTPLTRLENLQSIHLEKVNVRFDDIKWIAEMPRLEKVRLSCDILNIDWDVLFNHPGIKSVGMSSHDGYSVPDSEILKIAARAARQVRDFKRIGTKKRPAFVFELG